MTRNSNSLCAWISLLPLLFVLLVIFVNCAEGQSVCTYGDVRLVDGRDEYEGRVEICLNEEWGTVCNYYWDYRNNSTSFATVVCRQLGFIHKGKCKTIYMICIIVYLNIMYNRNY